MQFLAAKSRCTSLLADKYAIPLAMSWQILRNVSYLSPYKRTFSRTFQFQKTATIIYTLYLWIAANSRIIRLSFTLEVTLEVSIFHVGKEKVWGVAGVQSYANKSQDMRMVKTTHNHTLLQETFQLRVRGRGICIDYIR